MTQHDARITAVLDFWFAPETIAGNHWFKSSPAFDAKIRDQFGADVTQAAQGAYDSWTKTADGALALLILLDQFPRNMFRGTAQAFATDPKAQAIAQEAVARGLDQQVTAQQRLFFYLPFEHAEDRALQDLSVRMIATLANAELDRYAVRHAEIIRQFGRFPHRNKMLGRANTPDEDVYLAQHPNEFG